MLGDGPALSDTSAAPQRRGELRRSASRPSPSSVSCPSRLLEAVLSLNFPM